MRFKLCTPCVAALLSLLSLPLSTPKAQVGGLERPRIPLAAQDNTGIHAMFLAPTVPAWQAENWSGYAVTGRSFHEVSGQWVIPKVAKDAAASYVSTWIGIDGFNNQRVIQAGTEQMSSGSVAKDHAWYETYPNSERSLSPSTYPVRPGDRVTTTIQKAGSHLWRIRIASSRWKHPFVAKVNYIGPQESAEWILEAPNLRGRQLPLARFSSFSFAKITLNGKAARLRAPDSGAMVQNGKQLATPSYPNSVGNSFRMAYGNKVPKAPN